MRKFCKLSLVLLCCIVLSGCGRHTSVESTVPRLVTAVNVAGQREETALERHYTEPMKMESVLYYLRTLEDLGTPKTDPERIIGDSYKITVQFSDGGYRIYRQQANRFLSQNNHPWYQVDQRKAELLYPLLKSMPSDV